MKTLTLVLKGFCMGIADVIPGVSGGTLALILGVYRELIETIKAVSPAPLLALWRWLRDRSDENLDALKSEIGALNLTFLVPLLTGIALAFGIGSLIIPKLITDYPEATRAFFFGLILASVSAPFKMLDDDGGPMSGKLPQIIVGIVVGAAVGFAVTNPANSLSFATDSTTLQSEGETLKEITRRGPSAQSNAEVFWSTENAPLRDAIQSSNPALFENISTLHQQDSGLMDKASQKARNEKYETIEVPKGTPVNVPRLAYWFVFVAGFIAICAMILPGISGSYILLILGAYFFMLNALKGFLETLASGALPISQAGFVVVFCTGCLLGILTAARVLSYLLVKYGTATLAVLVGLMLGCLRGVWPFREQAGNVIANVLPTSFDGVTISVLLSGVVGFAIVAIFTYLGRQRGTEV